MKALAAILIQQKAPLALEEIDVPPPAMGQVLVKVLASGICGSQIGEIDGVKGPDRYLPHLLGHEGTGIVLEVGQGVRTVKPDDKVVLHWRKGAGLESVAPVYGSKIGPVNAGWVTTFNEFAIVSENRVTTIPRDFDADLAALFGCAVTTGFGVINNNAQLKIGQSIAIFGAGGIGLNIVQAAALVSAYPIIAVDLFDNRLALAGSLGATHLINSKQQDAKAEIRKIVGGAPWVRGRRGRRQHRQREGHRDGLPPHRPSRSDRARRRAAQGKPRRRFTPCRCTLRRPSPARMAAKADRNVNIPNYVRLCQAGKLRLAQLIGKRYPLRNIDRAIEDMRTGAIAGRALLAIGNP